MTLRPFTLARWGVYLAVAAASVSVWLGLREGYALDYLLMRSVIYFVIVTAIGFGAEAVLLTAPPLAIRPAEPLEDTAPDTGIELTD